MSDTTDVPQSLERELETLLEQDYFDPPVHRQGAYRHVVHDDLADTEAVSAGILALPMFTDLRDDEVEGVADVIAAVHEHADAIVASGHAYAD